VRVSGARRLPGGPAVPGPLALAGLERAGRGDEPPVDRQEIGLRQRALVRDRDAEEDLALPLGIADRTTAEPQLLVADRLRQLGPLVEELDDLPIEAVDPLPQLPQFRALRGGIPLRGHVPASAARSFPTRSSSASR